MPLGHTVNANIALVTGFSLHDDRSEAIRRGLEGFEFFGYALNSLVAHDQVPGRTTVWQEFQARRAPDSVDRKIAAAAEQGDAYASCIGTPEDAARYLRQMRDVGVDHRVQCRRHQTRRQYSYRTGHHRGNGVSQHRQ